ncbi:MAG: hypothetical protein M0R77_04430 [Gammaproteobacteria bacterium]|nr:hypothetical protein [Gammaproteobacteria bacterium]
MRKLKSILLALLCLPAAAYSLGLGDIHLRSALNQPLAAEIDLLSVAPDDVPSIVVSLASAESFQQVGLDRPAALLAIEFSVAQRPSGAYYIKAVTERPVREPFLDFLLEVNWRSGRLLRDYTVLLDPPELMKKEAPPAVKAPAATGAKPARTTKRASTAPKTGKGGALSGDGLRYGPVKGNETLWSIAKTMRPRSYSTPQVMMALLKGNPDAFEEGNVNRLKAGTVLRLDPALLQAMSRAEAAREVARQDREWQDFKQQAAGKAGSRAPTGTSVVPRGTTAVKPDEPRLKLVAPEAIEAGKAEASGTAAGEAGTLASLKQELLLAQEAGAASKQESEQLRQRVQDLEGQIADMQRLLSLQDDNLAALQRQLAGQGQQDVARAAPAAGAEVKPGVGVAFDGQRVEVAPAAAGEATAAVAAAANGEAAPAAEAAAPKAEEAAKPEAVKPAKKPAPKRPVVIPEPQPEPTLLDDLLANPVYSGLFLLLGVALVTLLVLIVRRRRSGGNFTESILMGGTPSMMKAKAAEGKGAEESSFFSDFAVSGMGDIQAEDSEVDPLTEADVYMAYQRYQQAEDLVQDALKHNPERAELHVKLLEVYHATKDKAKFEAEALRTHALLNGSGPLWDKVLVLGHELLPEHALFAKAPEALTPGPDHADARLDNEVLDIGLDLDALTEEMESGGGGGEFNLDLGVDFSDLEDLAPKAAPAVSAAPSAPVEETGFDLDLDALATDTPTSAPASAVPAAVADLDFDLGGLALDEPAAPNADAGEAVMPDLGVVDLSLDEPAAVQAEPAMPEMELSGLALDEPAPADPSPAAGTDLDLGDLDLTADAAPVDAGLSQDEDGFDLGSFDLNSLDLGTAGTEPAGELNLADMDLPAEDDADDLMLGDINEVDTKLDLARAYVGMGDSDGARNLLDEVMQEGDSTQKQQAEELLQQIA